MWLTQALHKAAQQAQHRTGTIFGERTRTWGEIARRVARLAGGLRSLGVERETKVAVLAHNSDNYLELLYAISWADGVSVPLNTRWAVPENVFALNDCSAEILFVDENFLHQIDEISTRLGRPITIIYMGEGQASDRFRSYERLIEESEPTEDANRGNEALCGIFYTGGTTGRPKGVMLSHTNLVFSSLNWIANWSLSDDTVCMHVAGLFHLAGTSPAFAVTMAGGANVFLPKFEPEPVFKVIERHRVNCCLFVPTMINMMMNDPSFAKYDLSSLRNAMYGASPMPEPVLRRALELLPTWNFSQGYGMTETAALVAVLPWKFHALEGPFAGKVGAAGRASYGVEMRIVDTATGAELPRGTDGEIAVRGALVMMGYWNQPEATAAALRNGWLHTGDAGWMDDDGVVYVVDRVKDMIISGGENIYSAEVERAIYQHQAVGECAVIGIPDEKWGETVRAVVVSRPGMLVAPDEIIAHVRSLIAGYKCPHSVDVRSEPLPLSAAAKIDKNALRAPFWVGRTRQVS
jgi:long-chain acyl-CoA synthetase